MIKDLKSKVTAQLNESILTLIQENNDCGVEEARDIAKNMSFSEYVAIREASVDMRQPTSPVDAAGPEGDPSALAIDALGKVDHLKVKPGQQGGVKDAAGQDRTGTVKSIVGNEYEIETDDGQLLKIPKDELSAPGELDMTSGSFMGDLKNAAKRGAYKGKSYAQGKKIMSSEDHDELNRIQELAGIEETSSAGATGAGAIAGGTATIVGNTAHTPTDRLRARLRREKEKKKKT